MSLVIMDFFLFLSKCMPKFTSNKFILTYLVLLTCDRTVFLVILKRLSMSGHTVLPNWECGYISLCVFACARSGRRCIE